MKMFKKIMAVALVGVMALSMLTGCAVKNENDMKSALKLAGQTRGVTVEVNNDKKVDGKKLSAWAEEAVGVLDDKVGEDLTGRYTFDDGKIIAYVIKEQNSTEKWRRLPLRLMKTASILFLSTPSRLRKRLTRAQRTITLLSLLRQRQLCNQPF